eukprot:Pgem_evm1s11970
MIKASSLHHASSNLEHIPRGVEERYQSIQLLGSGTFGDVYKSKDKMNDKIYAIKKIKVEKVINSKK